MLYETKGSKDIKWATLGLNTGGKLSQKLGASCWKRPGTIESFHVDANTCV